MGRPREGAQEPCSTAHEEPPMRKALLAIAGLLLGYVLGALAGALLVEALSANLHDKSLEAVMTGAFVTGPLGAVAGALTALLWPRPEQGNP